MNRSINVAEYLLAGKDPDRTALECVSQDVSYGRLRRTCDAVAEYLQKIGAAKGDRIILIGGNSSFWVGSYLGMLNAGMMAVPLPPDISQGDLTEIRRDTGAQVLFLESAVAMRLGENLAGLTVVTDQSLPPLVGLKCQSPISEVEAQWSGKEQEPAAVTPYSLAALMFTSGSTGRPRGVMVSHANIIANTDSIIEYIGLTSEDRMMTILPFHYCFGASLLHTHLRVGGTLIVEPRFAYPDVVVQRMSSAQCTGFAGVPSHYQILLRRAGLRGTELPHLRHVQQAGGPLAPSFLRELRQALPGTRIFVMYGQTEATARLAFLTPELLDTKMGSIGKAIPGVSLSVLNTSGEDVRPGEVGEIVAEGPNITLGYWGDAEETARTFRERRLYTGDIATVDEDRFIFIVDRAKNFLKCGGRRISTRQIEDLMLECEALREVAVIGIQDQILGEAVKAFLVPRDAETPAFKEQFLQHCRRQLPQEFVPKQIVILDALPKSSTGKVLKQALTSVEGRLEAALA